MEYTISFQRGLRPNEKVSILLHEGKISVKNPTDGAMNVYKLDLVKATTSNQFIAAEETE